ncbi:unnamed protein product [Cladocopium goreaui]|uniref:30S ribosomal protein S6 n=1 Tax=Cladocopium goreaui TaxID=2562237 RepID=A0A9P1DHK7_9DINO|nr:unnamed protein product [Cladocopium goreaui]
MAVVVAPNGRGADVDQPRLPPPVPRDDWKSVRHGKVQWTKEQVAALAQSMLDNIPGRAKSLIVSHNSMAGSHMLVLTDPDGPTRPTFKDIAVNFVWLKPFVEAFPDRVPSGFLICDVVLMLNEFLMDKLLLPDDPNTPLTREDQVEMAKEETTRMKKLLGALRYLWRNGPGSHDQRVADLKAILVPSPSSIARKAAAEKAKEEAGSDDETSAPDGSGEEDEPDSQSESEEVGSPRSADSKGSSVVFSCDESTYVPGEDGAMAMEHEQDLSSCSDISPEDKDMDSDSDTLELPGKDPISVQIRKRRRMKSMDDDKVKARGAKKGAAKAASKKKPSKGKKKASFRRGGKKQPKVANGLGCPEEYRGYDLKELPMSARPQPNRKHRGLHSYTVSTAVRDAKSNEVCEVLVDVLLQKKAYYIKKCPPSGKTGNVSWNKIGNAKHAWAVAMDRARCGNVL